MCTCTGHCTPRACAAQHARLTIPWPGTTQTSCCTCCTHLASLLCAALELHSTRARAHLQPRCHTVRRHVHMRTGRCSATRLRSQKATPQITTLQCHKASPDEPTSAEAIQMEGVSQPPQGGVPSVAGSAATTCSTHRHTFEEWRGVPEVPATTVPGEVYVSSLARAGRV